LSEAEDVSIDLQRLRSGDREAFGHLVERYQALVLSLGQSLGLAGADLDDAAAEVFAAVYRALAGFRGAAALETWIYRIAIRTLTRARQRHRRDRVEPLADDPIDSSQAPPSWRLETAEEYRRIWDAVAGLESRQAAAIELYYRHSWPLRHIAEALGCPEGTVKTLLFRAREQLRHKLGEREV
jgi:RNA polymerase sigma-70 factor (ECF subfamily)